MGVIGKGNMHHEKPCLCASPLMGPTRIYDSELDRKYIKHKIIHVTNESMIMTTIHDDNNETAL